MSNPKLPEVWLRGSLPGIPPLLQPVAHAILQAKEEINTLMEFFPDDSLWLKPYGMASVGFHLQHIVGILDRLFTYSEGRQLSDQQLKYLSREGEPDEQLTTKNLVDSLNRQIDSFIESTRFIDSELLLEPRGVGRRMLPSTRIGLLFHCAEHTMRHTGQLHVTVKIITGSTT